MNGAFPFSVVQGPVETGRIAVATRPLRPGDVVLAERSVVCVAAEGRDVCDDCLEPTRPGVVQCALCLGGNTTPGSCATPAVRLSAKLLWRRCSGSLGQEHASKVDGLVHHDDMFAGECGRDQEEDCAQVVQLAVEMAPRNSAGSPDTKDGGMRVLLDAMSSSGRPVANPIELVKQELGRVHVNAITTCDGSGATGLGLFPSAAMFNHSCSPNVQAWWRGSKLELRCTKPVAVGEELCFSYIPVDQPSKLRQEQLRHSWFFDCLCQRCVSGQWDAELSGLRCPVAASCVGAVPLPWQDSSASCNHCGGYVLGEALAPAAEEAFDQQQQQSVSSPSLSSAEARRSGTEYASGAKGRLLRARRDFEDGVGAYMREDAEAALVALKKSLAVQETLLHAFNKELLRTLRFASYAAVATSKWVEAHSFLVRWLHPMEVMYGAAEVWDIAVMRIDIGLVIDKLHPTSSCGASAMLPSPAPPPSQSKPSAPGTGDEMHPAASAELAQGLRWIRICLGKDSGLPAENAALESCRSDKSRSLLQAAAAV